MSKTALDELQGILFKKLPNGFYYHIDSQGVPQASIHREAVDKMMEIITDWHNKQVEEVLDRLCEQLEGFQTYKLAEPSTDILVEKLDMVVAIETERNKLKEAK